jgi:hypothetical protein
VIDIITYEWLKGSSRSEMLLRIVAKPDSYGARYKDMKQGFGPRACRLRCCAFILCDSYVATILKIHFIITGASSLSSAKRAIFLICIYAAIGYKIKSIPYNSFRSCFTD